MLAVLTAVLALLEAWIGLACRGVPRVLGLLGAVLILTALAVAGRSRRLATVLLVIGALPLPIVTWWSLVSPLVGVLCLALGIPAVRRASTRPTTPRRAWPAGPLKIAMPPRLVLPNREHQRCPGNGDPEWSVDRGAGRPDDVARAP